MLGCRPEIAIDGPRRVMAILYCDMSGNGSHQEPKLLRDRVIVSRRWMSGLLIGSLVVPRRIGLLAKAGGR